MEFELMTHLNGVEFDLAVKYLDLCSNDECFLSFPKLKVTSIMLQL